MKCKTKAFFLFFFIFINSFRICLSQVEKDEDHYADDGSDTKEFSYSYIKNEFDLIGNYFDFTNTFENTDGNTKDNIDNILDIGEKDKWREGKNVDSEIADMFVIKYSLVDDTMEVGYFMSHHDPRSIFLTMKLVTEVGNDKNTVRMVALWGTYWNIYWTYFKCNSFCGDEMQSVSSSYDGTENVFPFINDCVEKGGNVSIQILSILYDKTEVESDIENAVFICDYFDNDVTIFEDEVDVVFWTIIALSIGIPMITAIVVSVLMRRKDKKIKKEKEIGEKREVK